MQPPPTDTGADPAADSLDAQLDEGAGCVRFWVLHEGRHKGASVGREALHYRFRPGATAEDAMETFALNLPLIEAAVRRRFDEGAREPVMLREHDLRIQDLPAAG
jgi:hypothetical protein